MVSEHCYTSTAVWSAGPCLKLMQTAYITCLINLDPSMQSLIYADQYVMPIFPCAGDWHLTCHAQSMLSMFSRTGD